MRFLLDTNAVNRRFVVLPFDADDARHASEVRAALSRVGSPIGAYDVLIAGQARARGLAG